MSQSISFDEIPMDWRVPGTRAEIRPNRSTAGLFPYPGRTLIIAPKLTAGLGVTLTPLRVTRKEDAIAWAGAGSIAANMVELFLANNLTGELWLLLIDDASGGAAAAAGAIAFTGTATAAGTYVARIGGRRVAIPVNVGDTATVVGARLATAIGASAQVTALNTTGSVALTARHKGTIGNFIPVVSAPEPEYPVPAGLTVAVTAMAAGTGEADIAPAISAVSTLWYPDMAVPMLSTAYLTALAAEAERRSNAMSRLDTYVWGMSPGIFSALTTLGNGQNSRFISTLGVNAGFDTPWAWAAALAARAAFYLLNDPARQLRGIPLTGILAPPAASRFIETERDLLLRAGISTWNATDDGGVVIERVITMNQKTSLGVLDTAWLDVTTVKTLSRIRYDWISYMNATWPRAKLADDDAGIADYDPEIATPRRLHGSWAGRLKLYERQGWIQDANGCAAKSYFRRNESDRNRVDARLFVQVLGNLLQLNAVLEFTQ